jgi:hypothetical protein
MSDLFDLFKDRLKTEGGLVASEPHTLETLSEVEEEQDFFLEQISELEEVRLKVDYSDFANFVFFNSAFDYFNLTAAKILADYPYDGSREQVKLFQRDLDGYQKYVLDVWPSRVGHLRFKTSVSSSYVTVDDVGLDGDSGYRAGILSPGTGSISLEMWFQPSGTITASNGVQVLAQKVSSGTGYTLYLSGSQVRFSVTSASVTDEVASPFTPGQVQYVAGVFDRSSATGSITIFTGSATEFPVAVSSASINIFGPIDLGDAKFTMASGTLASKTTQFFTGSMDDVRVWKKARSIQEISSSFNVKQHAQKNLVALYRFNESGSAFSDADNQRVLDYSGHKLDGHIQEYFGALRGSGSLLLQEHPDPVLSIDTSDISEFITRNQVSGSAYDRENRNKITEHVPEAFLSFDVEVETDLLKNFLYVLARNLDVIKLHIDQFVNVLRVNYGQFDQTPDELLPMVANFFGWEFTGNFLNADAFQYLLGKQVLKSVQSNTELETKLFEIKNEFWRRVLLNLTYLYKTKGTRESVRALLRMYGVNENFVRIKEYGYTPIVGIQTHRINAEKSVVTLGFGSGSLSGSVTNTFVTTQTASFTAEARFKFPLTSSADIPATITTGSLFTMYNVTAGTASSMVLYYERDSISSHTGTLLLSASDGTIQFGLSGAGIFNNEWHHIAVVSDRSGSFVSIQVRHLENDEIDTYLTASIAVSGGLGTGPFTYFGVGAEAASGSNPRRVAQYWAQEARWWNVPLNKEELDDHALNFQSYGVSDPVARPSNLLVHWRLREDTIADESSDQLSIVDVSTDRDSSSLTSRGFLVGTNPYKKFLEKYNYIASMDFGWNEEKIRTFDAVELKPAQFVHDTKVVSLEFNLMDALNEDIVQMMSSLDFMNEAVGSPANKYRVHYDDLEILRHNYFKRLQGKLNFTVFSDLLEFFDRSFIDMVKKLIPARAFFMGDEFVVESHLLERPKVTYERRRNQETEFTPEGRIKVWSRFGRLADKTGEEFPLNLPR